MKKIALVLTLLLSFAFGKSFAQSLAVNVGDIPNATTPGPIYTTSDRIVRSAKLVANSPDAEVISYTFSIMKGTDLWGPISETGALFTADMTTHLKGTTGPNVKVFFDEIKVKQAGVMYSMPPIALKYDQ